MTCTCMKSLSMNTRIKYGVAVLVIALFVASPAGACAAIYNAATATPHPCCPAESRNECPKTSCVCASIAAAPVTLPETGDSGRAIAAPDNDGGREIGFPVHHFIAFAPSFFAVNRLIALHQFLI